MSCLVLQMNSHYSKVRLPIHISVYYYCLYNFWLCYLNCHKVHIKINASRSGWPCSSWQCGGTSSSISNPLDLWAFWAMTVHRKTVVIFIHSSNSKGMEKLPAACLHLRVRYFPELCFFLHASQIHFIQFTSFLGGLLVGMRGGFWG